MNKTKNVTATRRKSNGRRNGTNGARASGNIENRSHSAQKPEIVDLRERQRTESRLAEQARLLDLSNDAIVVRDAWDRIVYWNRGATEIYGYGAEEALGKVTHELLSTEYPEPLKQIRQKLEKTDRWTGELIHTRKDGRKITVMSRWALDRDVEGKPSSILETNTDISARKRAEQELELVSRLPHENPAPVIRLKKGRILSFANPAAEQVLEFWRKKLGDVAPKEFVRVSLEALQTGKRSDLEIEAAERCYAVAVCPVPERNYVNFYFTDITERKHAEQRFRQVVERAPNAMIMVDRGGRIVLANVVAEKLFGYGPDELTKMKVEALVPKRFRDKHGGFRAHFHAKPQARAMGAGRDLFCLAKNGTEVPVEIGLSPIRTESGTFVLASIVDLTERKRAELALERSRDMLEKLVQQRTRALRVANAELETEIVRRKGLEGQILEISDREQEKLGQELHDGLCQQLTAIGFLARATALRLKDHRVVQTEDLEKIAQLINSSVMDARNIARDLHKEDIEAAEFGHALHDLVDRKIWRTPCRLELKTEIDIEDDAAASQIYRILREAIINANKHARATEVILEVRRIKNDLVFSVRDNGVGLNRKPKAGQGLGFHIMDYRAKSIGARVEFESRKKRGTRVAVYLPLTKIK